MGTVHVEITGDLILILSSLYFNDALKEFLPHSVNGLYFIAVQKSKKM